MRIVPYFAIVLLAFLPIGKDVLSPIIMAHLSRQKFKEFIMNPKPQHNLSA